MGKTLVLGGLAAFVVAWSWFRLETTQPDAGTLLWVALVALVPALPRRWPLRVALLVPAVLGGLWQALEVSPLDARPFDDRAYFGPLWHGFERGLASFYSIELPFAASSQPRMHGIVLVAVFGFSLAIALAVAARRPLLAAGLLVVAAGWPATLRGGDGALLRGALILAVALVLLAGLAEGSSAARARQAALAGAAVVVAALAVASVPAVAKDAFLDWEQWDPYAGTEQPVNVDYVWDSDYGPIKFPTERTVVFVAGGAPWSQYWRSTTLDSFNGHRWLEELTQLDGGPFSDALLPQAAHEPGALDVTQVEVKGLADEHLVSPSAPVYYQSDDVYHLTYQSGIGLVQDGLSRDQRFTAFSYSARPTPAQLARIRDPVYGPELDRFLVIQARTRFSAPRFTDLQRETSLDRMFASNGAMREYEPLYRQARAIVGRPVSPYAAAVALETWFRASGDFRYDETPPSTGRQPPLVGFVTTTRAGHCQYYAGAMALMLRYLGIPARVAAGFTSGRFNRANSTWTVTDREAHTWVEVWFPRFGWLPFDPTPGRGRLSATYSSSSPNFNTAQAIEAITAGLDSADRKLESLFDFREGRLGGTSDDPLAVDLPGDVGIVAPPGDEPSLLRLLVLLAAGAAAAIALLKLVLRRARYLTRDPRRLAGACRRELAAFLADQRVDVPASATLSELGELVRHELGVDAAPFVAAASEARYGPEEQALEAARRARGELRRLERLLRERLSRFDRTRGLLSLRSLGLTG